jgi:hypothetical protein
MSIFCAVRAPPAVQERLYPSITPVNMFRVVFSGLFGDHWPLLPDRSFYSVYDTPFRTLEWTVDPPVERQAGRNGWDVDR